MSGRKYYCFCDSNCKFETMTKEQILAAIAQAAENGLVFDENAAFISKVKESNAGGFVSFWLGTQAQYNAIAKKDPNCFYILTDCDAPAELTQKVKDLQQRISTLTAADVGAAPAGYGLGGKAKQIEWSEIDNITQNGWYCGFAEWGEAILYGINISYFMIAVDAYDENSVVQTLTSTVDGYQFVRKKHLIGGWENGTWTWDEWECINPPMANGVEYRTTERFEGKAVYTRMDAVSALPSNSHKTWTHGIAMTSVIRYCGKTTTGRAIPYNCISVGQEIGLKCDTTEVCCSANFDATEFGSYYVQMWYTKD